MNTLKLSYYTHYHATYSDFYSYSFNAKEKDYESGFHYYGSRSYSSELSIWNSTDPMADKYPSLTPYNYCANNPVKLIDPNGEEIDEWSLNQKTGEIIHENDNKHYIGKIEVDKIYSQDKEKYFDFPHEDLHHMQKSEECQFIPCSNADVAELFYYFVAENSEVEWALAKSKYNVGYVGTDYKINSTWMLGLFEKVLSNNILLESHSHPLGGPPSKDISVGNNLKSLGDLNTAEKSDYHGQREVYSVPSGKIYGYDNKTRSIGRSYDYKENVQNRKDLLREILQK